MQKYALIETYGCQQNEADSDKLRGMLLSAGYLPTKERQKADIIIFNTCAVREHAELKVFGNVGALKHLKAKKPSLIIGLCGCMMQQQHRASEILEKHKQVDFILGTHTFPRLLEVINEVQTTGRRVCLIDDSAGEIAEGLPVDRENGIKAYITIMYGCDNFCSYCVVPYVRGRERSRPKEKIIAEAKSLIAEGYKELMLLGQNVNSYGKGLYEDYGFTELLTEIDTLEGEYKISFMTSHPKDAGKKLIDVMAGGRHIARHLHLPVQCGSDKVLSDMNRKYSTAQYLEIVDYARTKMPDVAVSSDIIVGFPTESEKDFEATIDFIKKVRFDALYTFIYSKRKNTPAAEMKPEISKEEKQARIAKLIKTQDEISKEKNQIFVGSEKKVLVYSADENRLTARDDGGRLVHFEGPEELLGKFVTVKVIKAMPHSMLAQLI